MRVIPLLCGLAALTLAPAATAVTLAPIVYSPEFEAELHNDFGVREGDMLRGDVEEAVSGALQRRGVSVGAGGGTIEITIVEADPNRPTMEQLEQQPGLDYIRSVSIGGAELHAVLRDENGQVVGEVDHRTYNRTLAEFNGFPPAGTWSEARTAIRRFATKVADAYVEHFGAR